MARQILKVPDLPPEVLIESEGDTRYVKVPDAFTQAAADLRYLQLTGGAVSGALTVQGKAVAASPDSGNALEFRTNGFYAGGGGGGSFSAIRDEEFAPAAAATSVDLAAAPTNIVLVSRNGVIQSQAAGNYSLSGARITFTDAFVAGERVAVVYEIGVASGDLAYTKNDSDLRFVNVAGDTMTGNLGIGAPVLTGGHPTWPFVQVGNGGVLRGDAAANGRNLALSANAIFKPDNKAYSIYAGGSTQIVAGDTGLYFYTAPSVAAGAELVMGDRAHFELNGMLSLYPSNAAGNVAPAGLTINAPAGMPPLICYRHGGAESFYITDGLSTATNTRLYASKSLELDSSLNFVTPARAAIIELGAPNFPWRMVWTGGVTAIGATNTQLLNLSNKVDVLSDASDHLRWRRLPSGLTFMRMIYSIPGLILDETVNASGDGQPWIGVSGGRFAGLWVKNGISGGPDAVSLNTSSSIHFNCNVYAHPGTDATMYLGHSGYRWNTIYLVSAPVVGSTLDLKEDIAPLDPAACVEAVLGTDWVAYHVKPPAPPVVAEQRDAERWPVASKEAIEAGIAVEYTVAQEREARLAEYEQAMIDTEPSRHQKGYVLQSPDHKVHDLFGLPDRKNRSDGADLAVVACALQNIAQRLAALEAHVGVQP